MISEALYRKIRQFAVLEMTKTKDPQHDSSHIERVKNNALQIIKILGLEKEIDINLLKVICLLHDFTYTVKKPSLYTYFFEGHLERKVIQKVLSEFAISPRMRETIVNAVYRHTHSFPFRRLNKNRGIYTKVLQDADTLDLFTRMRVKTFNDSHAEGVFKSLMGKFSYCLVKYGRKHLAKFLNYPSIAKSYYV